MTKTYPPNDQDEVRRNRICMDCGQKFRTLEGVARLIRVSALVRSQI